MPNYPPFTSFAQNREDVVLFRALGHLPVGRYVEVGANHPTNDSATRAFYDRGWSGVTVEPIPEFAALQRAERPRDWLIEGAISASTVGRTTIHVVPGTGLSTLVDAVAEQHRIAGIAHTDVVVDVLRLDDALRGAGWAPVNPIHFMLIDVEGAERDVLESIDLNAWRPWILVIESTAPNSTDQTHDQWEQLVTDAGYDFCLFDGISRFYVAREHAAELGPALAYAACVLDNYTTNALVTCREHCNELETTSLHWRTTALTSWAHLIAEAPKAGSDEEIDALQSELQAMKGTISWRITAPLRAVRRSVASGRTTT